MEAPSKPAGRCPHVALLYVLVAALLAAQLAGFLLLRHQLAEAERACVERVRRVQQQTVQRVVELTRATRAVSAGVDGTPGERTPSRPQPAAGRRRRRQTSQAVVESAQPGGGALAEHRVEYTDAGVGYRPGRPGYQTTYTVANGRAADGQVADPEMWLNSSSRITVNALNKFCMATKEYCPPGEAGTPGITGLPGKMGETGGTGTPGRDGQEGPRGPPGAPGEKGSSGAKGDVGQTGEHGIPGLPGHEGPIGPPGTPGAEGPRGPEGKIGKRGQVGRFGLDGRDGLPGEPGLDGIPGRNGLDGFPGVDGIPGLDGSPGINGTAGRHGRDGERGEKGDEGDIGPSGFTGMPGPRGVRGSDGQDGIPGLPGVNTSLVNSTEGMLLIPPWIPKASRSDDPKMIRVSEGDNLVLRCVATGVPRPNIEWAKEDLDGAASGAIYRGAWKESNIEGRDLKLIKIHRMQKGRYKCTASNGIPPDANKIFQVIVMFSPLIYCQNNQLVVHKGSSKRLECHVESSPLGLTYWMYNDKVLKNDTMYTIYTKDNINGYKTNSSLYIRAVGDHEYGKYYCISKNEVGVTEGAFTLYPPGAGRSEGAQNRVYYGRLAPNITDQDKLCPPLEAVPCRECPALIYPTGAGYPTSYGSQVRNVTRIDSLQAVGLDNRTMACELSAVGKPVYNRDSHQRFGAWMRDAEPPSLPAADKYWYTNEHQTNLLFEYSDKYNFDRKTVTRNVTLPEAHQGNSHVVYNGSFYYHSKGRPEIVRFNLREGRITNRLHLPHLAANLSISLYNSSYTYADFAVDENGLWVIYALPGANLGIVKLQPMDLKVLYTWNISFMGNSHAEDGDTIIVCGVLYGIKSVTESTTKFSLALDLYTVQSLPYSDLTFTNPFRHTTMVGYNPRNKEIYSWDKGNQLTYPVKYNALDDGSSNEEPSIDALMQAPDHVITEPDEEE